MTQKRLNNPSEYTPIAPDIDPDVMIGKLALEVEQPEKRLLGSLLLQAVNEALGRVLENVSPARRRVLAVKALVWLRNRHDYGMGSAAHACAVFDIDQGWLVGALARSAPQRYVRRPRVDRRIGTAPLGVIQRRSAEARGEREEA